VPRPTPSRCAWTPPTPIARSTRTPTRLTRLGVTAGGGAVYGLGIFGALVYFWQQADGLWEHLLAVVQGLFWPAFMVYEVFKALRRSG
jgi:hypothetical protein